MMERALPLLGPGRSMGFAVLPEGADPETLVRHGRLETLYQCVADSRSLPDMLWQRETGDGVFDSPERRAALDTALMAAVEAIPDASIRAEWIADLAARQEEKFGFSALSAPGGNGPDSAARRGQTASRRCSGCPDQRTGHGCE